ncbi:MAG: amidase family protein, partial [Clostridia bacterium]
MGFPLLPALCGRTVAELAGLLARGETTSAAIVRAYLRSIELQNELIHAYLEAYPEDALREAEASDARRAAGAPLSPLDGVPIAVKDNMVMQNRLCSCASRMLADFRSPYDATVITRVRGAGMPILGRL